MTYRRLLPLFLLVGCFARKEATTVLSPFDSRMSLDVVERVFATAGYMPVSEDNIEGGREVIHSQWRDYPPGHEANGPYQRRPVAILTPNKQGISVELRIDVARCINTGTDVRCDGVDLLFDSDKKELDALTARLQQMIDAMKRSGAVLTAASSASTPTAPSAPSAPSSPQVSSPPTAVAAQAPAPSAPPAASVPPPAASALPVSSAPTPSSSSAPLK